MKWVGHVIKSCEGRRPSQKIWSRTDPLQFPLKFINLLFITYIYIWDRQLNISNLIIALTVRRTFWKMTQGVNRLAWRLRFEFIRLRNLFRREYFVKGYLWSVIVNRLLSGNSFMWKLIINAEKTQETCPKFDDKKLEEFRSPERNGWIRWIETLVLAS